MFPITDPCEAFALLQNFEAVLFTFVGMGDDHHDSEFALCRIPDTNTAADASPPDTILLAAHNLPGIPGDKCRVTHMGVITDPAAVKILFGVVANGLIRRSNEEGRGMRVHLCPSLANTGEKLLRRVHAHITRFVPAMTKDTPPTPEEPPSPGIFAITSKMPNNNTENADRPTTMMELQYTRDALETLPDHARNGRLPE